MPDVFAGRFELIDPVGTGGTGTVWRAWDRRLERLCAAKVLRQRHAGELLRFVREQGMRLDHPNVLSPYGWAADDDQALLAMDLVGGGSVSSLVADFGPLPERYAAELLGQLLGALHQVHTAGLVHRDVKPANLLLEATGTGHPVLRLSDFGIALNLSEPRLTQHGSVVGTPGYLAPETLAGEPPSTAQDLYAAGVTGWQLLTGAEPPSSGPLPPLSDSRGSLVWDVVNHLLQATDRTPSAKAALEELAPVLSSPLSIPAHTIDGELIEVFDQLPPLPDGVAFEQSPPKKGGSDPVGTDRPAGPSQPGSSSPGQLVPGPPSPAAAAPEPPQAEAAVQPSRSGAADQPSWSRPPAGERPAAEPPRSASAGEATRSGPATGVPTCWAPGRARTPRNRPARCRPRCSPRTCGSPPSPSWSRACRRP